MKFDQLLDAIKGYLLKFWNCPNMKVARIMTQPTCSSTTWTKNWTPPLTLCQTTRKLSGTSATCRSLHHYQFNFSEQDIHQVRRSTVGTPHSPSGWCQDVCACLWIGRSSTFRPYTHGGYPASLYAQPASFLLRRSISTRHGGKCGVAIVVMIVNDYCHKTMKERFFGPHRGRIGWCWYDCWPAWHNDNRSLYRWCYHDNLHYWYTAHDTMSGSPCLLCSCSHKAICARRGWLRGNRADRPGLEVCRRHSGRRHYVARAGLGSGWRRWRQHP